MPDVQPDSVDIAGEIPEDVVYDLFAEYELEKLIDHRVRRLCDQYGRRHSRFG